MNLVKRPSNLTAPLKGVVFAAMFSWAVFQSPAVVALQDNPFAVPESAPQPPRTGPPAAARAAGVGEGVLEITNENARTSIGLVVRSVRGSDPQSPKDLLNAIETLLDVGAIGDARFYLDKLIQQNLKPQQLFDLFQQRGTEFFYQLHATDELAPAGKSFAKNVLDAAKTYASSDQRIDELIKALSHQDINVRSDALGQVKRIGPPAYAAMLEAFADDNRSAEFRGIRGAIQHLGDDATEILIAAARSGHAQIQAESYVALTKLQSKAALEFIALLYLSPNTSAAVKQLAQSALERAYGEVDRQQLYRDISDQSQASLKVIRASFDSQTLVNEWSFDAAANKFVRNRISASLAAKRSAAVQAQLLYQLQPENAFNRQLFLLTQLESAKRAVGPDDRVDARALIEKFDSPTVDELNHLLKRAMQLKLLPASIAICQLLGEMADPAALQTTGRGPLIDAILYGDRHLQFAALEAVAAIDPQTAYPGSSHVLELAAFLVRTDGTEKALVGHFLGPSSRSFASVVAGSGLSVSSARNGRQFYNAAVESPDFKIFVVTESLRKPAARELIQLLRSDWRTRQVPIAFVGDDNVPGSSMEILAQGDPLLGVLELSFDSRIVKSQLDETQTMSSSWPVSSSNRLLHGQVAANWMLKIIDQRDTYRFYRINKHEESIYRLLAIDGYTEKACEMISKLGTAKSQETLANFASQPGYKMEQRAVATKCFANSVQRFGTLLTTDQIRQQYDRYNASESATAEVQKLMGQLLDAIEKRSKESKTSS